MTRYRRFGLLAAGDVEDVMKTRLRLAGSCVPAEPQPLDVGCRTWDVGLQQQFPLQPIQPRGLESLHTHEGMTFTVDCNTR